MAFPITPFDDDRTPLSLEIGSFVLAEQGSTARALERYSVHSAEIVLAAILLDVERGVNHRVLRERILGMATLLDKVSPS